MKKTPLLRTFYWISLLGILFLVILFLIGTFFDYQISSWFTPLNAHNFYAIFFKIFGMGIYTIPCAFIVVFFLNWLAFTKQKPKCLQFRTLIFGGFTLVFLFLDSIALLKKHGSLDWIAWAIGVVIYLAIYWVVFGFFNQKTEIQKFKNHQYRLQVLLAMIIYAVITYLTVYFLKLIFARPRMINILENKVSYQSWWNIDWKNHNIKFNSFPSGHVGVAMSSLGILFLFKKSHWSYFVLASIVWVVILLVAGSRIVYLRHFLTDVIFAMLIGIGYFYFGSWIARKNWLNKLEVRRG